MRLLFLTVAPIGSVSASGVYTDLIREFRRRGHDVYVVSPAERQYGLAAGVSVEDGITVARVRSGAVTKARSALVKGIATLAIEQQFIRALKRYLPDVGFDLVLCTAPPVNIDRLVTYAMSRVATSKSYLLLKDIFPQNAVDLGLMTSGGLAWRYFRYREKRLYAVSDHIGCMSEANVAYVLADNPELPRERVEVCPNGIEPSPLPARRECQRSRWLPKNVPANALLLVYGGNLGLPQGIDFLLRVLDESKDRADLFFLIAGSGTEYERIEGYLAACEIANARLIPAIPRQEFTELLASADIGLIFLDQRFSFPNFPSRLTAYLEAGLPVLSATDPHTDIPKILAESGAGIGVLAGDVRAFISAIDELGSDRDRLTAMGLRGRAYLEEHYTVGHCYEIIMGHQQRDGDLCGQ